MLIETLESRELMSASSPLLVVCTSATDHIHVTQSNGILNVNVNGSVKASVNAKLCTGLTLDTVAGADVIDLDHVGVAVTVKAGANVIANIPVVNAAANVLIDLGIHADVLAKLNLSKGIDFSAGANVNAALGVLSMLSIGKNGALCAPSGVAINVNACLSLLAKLQVQTHVAV